MAAVTQEYIRPAGVALADPDEGRPEADSNEGPSGRFATAKAVSPRRERRDFGVAKEVPLEI